jgi:hypothetical protein
MQSHLLSLRSIGQMQIICNEPAQNKSWLEICVFYLCFSSVFFIHKILPNFNLKNMISTYKVLLVLTSLILILGH